ncbi:MAG: protocatechuate 3,4-dioxygenase subunit alpha [Pseudomonadota bacterium]
MTKLKETPSQTAGPYLHIGCMPNAAGIPGVYATDPGAEMVSPATIGERVSIEGVIIDGVGAPVTDALVEIWQADAAGRYPGNDPMADPAFAGWGRAASDPQTGLWQITTIRPGPVPWTEGGRQAPHLSLWIAARGLNVGLQTRMYFPGVEMGSDPVLALAGTRAETLIATELGAGRLRFDIHLQGARETVFFDV